MTNKRIVNLLFNYNNREILKKNELGFNAGFKNLKNLYWKMNTPKNLEAETFPFDQLVFNTKKGYSLIHILNGIFQFAVW